MERAESFDAFARCPVGRWFAPDATSFVWCAAPDLAGCVIWGRRIEPDSARTLDLFDAVLAQLAPRFDVVLDGRCVEGVDPDALTSLLAWIEARRSMLAQRVRMQYGLVAHGMSGVMLAGILPVLGDPHPHVLLDDPREALGRLRPDGAQLADEVDAIAAQLRSASPVLRSLRDLLRSPTSPDSVDAVARELGVAPRTLQRALRESGTSFRDELRAARLAFARELLIHGDDKIAVVARRVGLSENALTELVRDGMGVTPAELRRRHR